MFDLIQVKCSGHLHCAGDVILEGGAPFEGCADLSGGNSVLMGDTYGDGWNGNTYQLEMLLGIEVGASGLT